MSELATVHEIILEMDMVFDHFIIFKDKDGRLIAKIRVDPKESWAKLKEFHKKWEEAKRRANE